MSEITPKALRAAAADVATSNASKLLAHIADLIDAEHHASLEALIRCERANAQTCLETFNRLRQVQRGLDDIMSMGWLFTAATE